MNLVVKTTLSPESLLAVSASNQLARMVLVVEQVAAKIPAVASLESKIYWLYFSFNNLVAAIPLRIHFKTVVY